MGPRLRVAVTVVIIVGLLLAAYPLQRSLRRERAAAEPAETKPPVLVDLGAASILLLGGFRGLAVDALWLKSISLHEDRRYHEERALLDIISTLQPRFASVWVFQAWNIAFNISVQYEDPDEQYKWIREGTAFLRKGVDVLPDNADVAFYMGVLYAYKYPQNPRFQELLQEREGINSWEEAARWFDRSRTLIREGKSLLSEFNPRVADSGVFHAWLSRYQQILEQGKVTSDGFDSETLALAEPWRKKAQEEADGLNQRWPNDAAFVSFPARVAAVPADAWLFHARKAMLSAVARGDSGPAAEDQPRRCLDLARKSLERVSRDFPDAIDKQILDLRRDQIALAIPTIYFQAAGPVIAGQAQPPREDVVRARSWLARARVLLTETDVKSGDAEMMRKIIPDLLQRADQLLSSPPPSPLSSPPPANQTSP